MPTLKLHTYQIHLGDVAQILSDLLATHAASQLFVLVDENTEQHCWPRISSLPALSKATLIRIPSGEAHKNIQTCTGIWQQLMDAGATRGDLMINLGGGVIGDMGGFCASTFKRGMDFIQVPTTLLSQVDASVGGKLGIDFAGLKNSVGLFCDPRAVVIDTGFLETLPPREIRSGFAEMIKHALIADASQWDQLQQLDDLKNVNWSDFLLPSLEIKRRIVAEDVFEKGIRKALNFGHTIGHAVESHFLNTLKPLLHGEAIATGMICEAYLSVRQTGLQQAALDRITRFLLRIYGHVDIENGIEPELNELMKNDKKNERPDAINCTLLSAEGVAMINQICSPADIHRALDYYRRQKID